MNPLEVMVFVQRDGITGVRYSTQTSTHGKPVFVARGDGPLNDLQWQAFVGLVYRTDATTCVQLGYRLLDGNHWARTDEIRPLSV